MIIFLLFSDVIVVVKILIFWIIFDVLVVLIKLFFENGLKINNMILVVKFFREFCKDRLIVKFVVLMIVIREVVFICSWFNDVIIINSIRIVDNIDLMKLISILLYFDFVIIWWKIDSNKFMMIWLMINIMIVIIILIFYGMV